MSADLSHITTTERQEARDLRDAEDRGGCCPRCAHPAANHSRIGCLTDTGFGASCTCAYTPGLIDTEGTAR